MLVFVMFPGNVEFAGAAVAVLAFGDPAACLIGSALGRSPLPWNPRKSWAGSLGFFAVAAPPATLAYYYLAQPDVPMLQAAVCGVSAAFAAAIAESLRSRITDNLRIGLAAAVTVVAAHFLTASWFLS
jgi:dolichol kinase